MKTSIKRQFEVNRYRANADCPCGRSNRKGRFATEKGFSGQPIGYCFTCGKNFWSDNNTIVKPYQQQVEVLPICFCETKELKDSFDTNLESSFSQFLLKTFGEYKAIDIVEKYFLPVRLDEYFFEFLSKRRLLLSNGLVSPIVATVICGLEVP